MAAIYLIALIGLLCKLTGLEAHGPVEYTTCLSCPHVGHPRECKTFTEVWPNERCSVEFLLLTNGSTVYQFGFETATACDHSTSPQGLSPPRQRRMSSNSISLCHECCADSLCNRKLCGISGGNNTNLACLFGQKVGGLPSDTSIAYCGEGEQCYLGQLHHPRPNQINYGNYGCASQAACDRILSLSTESSTLCRKCCSSDGCNAHICPSQVIESHETTASTMGTSQSVTQFIDCWDLRSRGGFRDDGIYDIYPGPTHTRRLRVKCDMRTDGGGWVIIQRRYDGSLNFTRTFVEYEEGFGDITGEHWGGLDWIHVLTEQQDDPVDLRIDLCDFNDTAGYAVYTGFSISGRNDTYRLHAGRFTRGSLPDEFGTYSDGRMFQATEGYCAQKYRGGWWYRNCSRAYLNGGRYNGGSYQGIFWSRFGGRGGYQSLRTSQMMVRAVNVTRDRLQSYTCPH